METVSPDLTVSDCGRLKTICFDVEAVVLSLPLPPVFPVPSVPPPHEDNSVMAVIRSISPKNMPVFILLNQRNIEMSPLPSLMTFGGSSERSIIEECSETSVPPSMIISSE